MSNQLAFNLTFREPWLPDHFDRIYVAMKDDERAVFNALTFHAGASNSIKFEDLAAEAFPFRPKWTRERVTREIVKQLTEVRKIAIAASCRKPYGVYFITDPDELLAYTNNLTARLVSIARRISSLKRVSLPTLLGQLRVQFETAKGERS